MDPMPRKNTSPPPTPSNGENGAPPPEVDIADLRTALLGRPASRERLVEDMAAAHDAEVKRLRGWRAQVRAWLETAIPALQAPMRRLHWLRNERNLSALERVSRDTCKKVPQGLRQTRTAARYVTTRHLCGLSRSPLPRLV
jgi:hypothetical protein